MPGYFESWPRARELRQALLVSGRAGFEEKVMITLTDEAAAKIRAALKAAVELHGGGLEPEVDPDLSLEMDKHQAALERQLREAVRLLDEATART